MPTHDWQFWIVTLLAASAAGWMVWRGVRALRAGKRGKAKGTRTNLTVGGRRV
jgi:hypothetical protein